VIDGRHLQFHERHAVRQRRRVEQVVVGNVGQQAAVQRLVLRHRAGDPEPDTLFRRAPHRVQEIRRIHRAEFKWPLLAEETLHLFRHLADEFRIDLAEVAQRLRRRRVRHRGLVIEAGLGGLERCRHGQDRLAVLDRHHAPAGEAAAVAAAVHLEDDRHAEVAAAQEVGVQRVHAAPVHGPGRGDQGLPQHLPAEDLRRADVAALAAEQVVLEGLEVAEFQQVGEPGVHDGRRLSPAARRRGARA
jgi:hypothetical protein